MAFHPEMRFRDCPWCDTRNVAMSVELHCAPSDSFGQVRVWSMLICPRCAGAVLVETDEVVESELRVVPSGKHAEGVEDLPDSVAKHYERAVRVLDAGVASSTAVELRKTLEAAAQAHGINDRPLARAIERLAEEGLVTKRFVDVLGHIRKLGNLGAHASDEDISIDEARMAMEFTTQVLKNLFEIPAKLSSLSRASDVEEGQFS